jgi:Fur family peroxide stress response transcriptional regulator
MDIVEIRNRLKNSGLRVTPQRIAVLLALIDSDKHPDADQIARVVRAQHPNIAVGTIYHILDNLVQKGIINKVQTEQNVVRYDAIVEPHIHLYSGEENRIEDYFDKEFFDLIDDYLQKKKIKGFKVNDVRIKFLGEFTKERK